MKINKLALIGGGTLLLLIAGEIILREKYGMCEAPLYAQSDEWEYLTQPNQDGYRFGKHYHFNSYGIRCDEPDSTRSIVLGLGDSVLNGGVILDQDSIATSIISRETDMQMLNISAGSWGPDNCAAFLKHYGLFGAKAIFLLVSSHDAFDNIDHKPVVGVHSSFPDSQYSCAWAELINRYLWPKFMNLFKKSKPEADPDQKVLDGVGIHKTGKSFNPGFDELLSMAIDNNIPMYVMLHPDAKEMEQGYYNEQGQEIINWCANHNIQPILELDEGYDATMFRDGIHTNEKGQRFQAELMKKYIQI